MKYNYGTSDHNSLLLLYLEELIQKHLLISAYPSLLYPLGAMCASYHNTQYNTFL